MKFNEFADKIRAEYAAQFPKSACRVVKYDGIGGRYIDIGCYLAANKDECANGYWINDMMKVSFQIELPSKFNFEADELPEMAMRCLAARYHVKPENQYMCYGSHSVKYRLTRGDAEKIIKAFGKFVDRLYTNLQEDLEDGNIHENHIKILTEKMS